VLSLPSLLVLLYSSRISEFLKHHTLMDAFAMPASVLLTPLDVYVEAVQD
jgi:hypothetical protein